MPKFLQICVVRQAFWENVVDSFSCFYIEIAYSTGFPLGLENLEKWEGIFQSGKSQGILNRLEKSGKATPNTGKLREFQKKIICYFSMIFK